jgi:hypothetical protein
MRGGGAGVRKLTIEDENTGQRRKVSRPSWAEMVAGAKEPDYDPYGLLPEDETFRDHVENFKERVRRGRGQKSPEVPDDFHSQVENLRDHIRSGGGPGENGGRVWYPAAHDRADWISEKTHGDLDRTIGTDSALSPLKDWDLNTEQSAHYNLQYPWDRTPGQVGDPDFRIPGPNSQNDKARRILDLPEGATREDIANVLGGPKTRSFQNNIGNDVPLREPRTFAKAHRDFMDQHQGRIAEEESPYWHGDDPEMAKRHVPDDHGFYQNKINPHTGEPDFRYTTQDVTADTHHVRAHTYHPDADISKVGYGTPDWFSEKMTIGGKDYYPGYELSSRIAQTANAELNAEEADAYRHTIPSQAQATGWKQWKETQADSGSAAKQPAPGETPRGYDENKKNWGMGVLNKGTEEVVIKDPDNPRKKKVVTRPVPDDDPAPQYQYDRDPEWFHDPRRPQPGPVYDRTVTGEDGEEYDNSWKFKPGDGYYDNGHFIPPERATRTVRNNPMSRGKPNPRGESEVTRETFDPRATPNWGRRPKNDDEWRDRDYNQYLTELWGDPGERGRWAFVKKAFDWRKGIDEADLEMHRAPLENGHELHAWKYFGPESKGQGWNWAIADPSQMPDGGNEWDPDIWGPGEVYDSYLATGGDDTNQYGTISPSGDWVASGASKNVVHTNHIETLDQAKDEAQQHYQKMFPVGGPGTGSHDSGVDYDDLGKFLRDSARRFTAFDWKPVSYDPQKHSDYERRLFAITQLHKAPLENGHELHAWRIQERFEPEEGWHWAITDPGSQAHQDYIKNWSEDDPGDNHEYDWDVNPQHAGSPPPIASWLAAGGIHAGHCRQISNLHNGPHFEIGNDGKIDSLDEAKRQAQNYYHKMFPLGTNTGPHDSGVDYSDLNGFMDGLDKESRLVLGWVSRVLGDT